MSGLVAYGSSDDEKDDAPAEVGSSNNIQNDGKRSEAEASKALNFTTADAAGPAPNVQAPTMGPAIAPEQDMHYESYDEVNDLTDMSERDAVRYLTQASHPMTEMPPSPPGSPNPNIRTKFQRFLELKTKGTHFNEDLASKHAFRNPALLQAMTERIGISEHSQQANSLPKTVFDAASFPTVGYKEALFENQQAIRLQMEKDRRAQSAAGSRGIGFQSAGPLQQ